MALGEDTAYASVPANTWTFTSGSSPFLTEPGGTWGRRRPAGVHSVGNTDLPFSVKDSPAFRCTDSEATVQPSPYLSCRLPKDFVDLSTGEDAHKLIDFLKLVSLALRSRLLGGRRGLV